MNAAIHMLDTMRAVGVQCEADEARRALAAEAAKLLALAEEELHGASLAEVRERGRETIASLGLGPASA